MRMAQPWFEVRHLERKAGLIALSANFELYGDMSSRMMLLAAEVAPRQEIYTIDECFLDFNGVPGDRVAIGREIRSKVLTWTGLPTSIGFGCDQDLGEAGQPCCQDGRSQARQLPARTGPCLRLRQHDGRAARDRDGRHRSRRGLGHQARGASARSTWPPALAPAGMPWDTFVRQGNSACAAIALSAIQ